MENIINPEIQELAKLIAQYYQPVATTADADLIINTWQLYHKFQSFIPGEYSSYQVYHAMLTAGFEPNIQPGLEICWLLKAI